MAETETLDAPEVLAAAPPLKWASWPGDGGQDTPSTTIAVGTIVGSGGQAPGAFAVGDLYIVTAVSGLLGGINDFTISGSGWTKIFGAAAGDKEIKLFGWWKKTSAGETGLYTVTTGSSAGEGYSWAAWNFGQNAFVDAWNSIWSNVVTTTNGVAAGCFPTSSNSTLLAYWFNFHDATGWTLPGGLTTIFNNTQGGLPSQGASATKTLAAAGFTGNLTATLGTAQQFGAFQIAISTGAPPNGGGGASPIKWLSFMATQPVVAMGNHVVVGTDAIAQTFGSFASGDLYIVAVTVEADTGPSGVLAISGTGWTKIVETAVGALNTRMTAWAKNVGSGETGIYTVSWPNATGNPNWTVWNYGQATFDAAAGQSVTATGTNLIAPSVTTAQTNEAVLAYWFAVDSAAPGVGVKPPTTLTPRAINLQGQFKWDMTTGDRIVASAGAAGALTATAITANMNYTAFQAAIIPSGGGPTPPPDDIFPAFTPQLPPPTVGTGGSVPLAIAPAPVPPSVAGIPQPVFTFGSPTAPPASAAFPEFTTTFPVPPVIINAPQNTNTPIWVAPAQPPPSQTTTPPLGTSYNTGGVYGPPRGPALPPVVPPIRPFFMVATNGNPDDVVYPEPEAEAEAEAEPEPEPDPEPEPEPETHRSTRRTPPPRGRRR